MATPSVKITDTSARKLITLAEQRVSVSALAGHMAGVIQPYLSRRARARFKMGGDDASGGAWTPLSESTKRVRKSLGYGAEKPINIRTGHMRDTIVGAKPDVVSTDTVTTLAFPGNGIMGRPDMFHRGQQTIGNRSGPAREVVAVDKTDIAQVLSYMSKFIVGGIIIGGR